MWMCKVEGRLMEEVWIRQESLESREEREVKWGEK
jgi:hypothetical protein